MLINGYDINNLHVKLYDRVLTSNQVDTAQDWLDGDFQPTLVRQQDKFKSLKLQFLVLEQDENSAFVIMSKLTSMLKKAVIQFDDLDYTFNVSLNGQTTQERLKNGKFILTFNLNSDYAQGEEEVYTTDTAATNSFKLTVMYYRNDKELLANETVTISQLDFKETGTTFEDLGISLDKYVAPYYQKGVPTNFTGIELTYDNLLKVQALIVNYKPITYSIDVQYYKLNANSIYDLMTTNKINFTYPQFQELRTIGELIDIATYKPDDYRGRIMYDGALVIEDVIAKSPISVYYDLVQNEQEKDVTIIYKKEIADDAYEIITQQTIHIKESSIVDGMKLSNLFSLDGYKPAKYYDKGAIQGHVANELITYEGLNAIYTVEYKRTENNVYVEYYKGTYPDWFRISTTTLVTKYDENFDEDGFSVTTDLGLSIDRYLTSAYNSGVLIDSAALETYDDVLNKGVLQVFYVPKTYTIDVRYYQDSTDDLMLAADTIEINDLMFVGNPVIGDIIPLNAHKPANYALNQYYNGEVTLDALLMAAPLTIVYTEVLAETTKDITIRYKKELNAAYSTIATAIITVSESQCVGGVRLNTLIDVNKNKPEFYNDGIIDGYSSAAVFNFGDLQSAYTVLYTAKTYSTNVRYYTDVVDDYNWIGSDVINYRIIDFSIDTTLYDLGLNLNLYKPSYCGDGELEYTGPVSFTALQALAALNVVYMSITEPDDPLDPTIKYPKRFLYLESNDMKNFEHLFPSMVLNHAYINTGFTCLDMSKVTIIVEAEKLYPSTNLTELNVGDAFLFGSTGDASLSMKFMNNTSFLPNGVETKANSYAVQAGFTPTTFDEASAIGFSRNSGIYSSDRTGYSYTTLTYTNTIKTDATPVQYPVYLFANNLKGQYSSGIAGMGIYGCKIYYNDVLMRDFIPVQYFDKVGTKVAPSNCLFDKISQTFFEDARGKNSFKVKDDPEWTNVDPQFNIGYCFVNYYKEDALFKTETVWFRGDDFNTDWDLNTKFKVDELQPQYFSPGEVLNVENMGDVTFDKLNKKSFDVRYKSLGYNVIVNYWKDAKDTQAGFLATDRLTLSAADFYSTPTFGDLIRINKYKPEGYATDFAYTGKPVLSAITSASPYDIVYTVAPSPQTYTTDIHYYKEIKGGFADLGTVTVTLDSTNFRDGEYIDFHINWNAKKPQYCADGAPHGWYRLDERITNAEDLKPTYSVKYAAAPQNIEIRYYTDVVDEANMIASKNWQIKQTQWTEGSTFLLENEMPYDLVNQFKPAICLAGAIQDSSTNFVSLTTKGYVDIIYTTVQEPNDPDEGTFPKKVLYFDSYPTDELNLPSGGSPSRTFLGAKRPWIDTGFTPRDLSRLTIEAKTYALADGCQSPAKFGTYASSDYAYYIGYYGAMPEKSWDKEDLGDIIANAGGQFPKFSTDTNIENASVGSSGCCAVRAHWPVAGGFVYTTATPQSMDGYTYISASGASGNGSLENITSATGVWRKGLINQNMDVYRKDKATGELIPPVNEIYMKSESALGSDYQYKSEEQTLSPKNAPITVVLSPYRNELEAWNYENSNSPKVVSVDAATLELQQENVNAPTQPVDSLTIFATRNPDTGAINLPTSVFRTSPGSEGANVYGHDVAYANYPSISNPGITRAAIWYVKIWDKDKLVRHLIPVEEGQEVYDYVAPSNCLFDLVTETFFENKNDGGVYYNEFYGQNITVNPQDVIPLQTKADNTIWGKITVNYYKDGNTFLGSKIVEVPAVYDADNTSYAEMFNVDAFQPGKYHKSGRTDYGVVGTPEGQLPKLKDIFDAGYMNVFYDQVTFTKEVKYYKSNTYVASSNFTFTLRALELANTLVDLGIATTAFDTPDFKSGRYVFDDGVFERNEFETLLNMPSIPVIMDRHDVDSGHLYFEYYRQSASADNVYTAIDNNYFSCNILAKVLKQEGTESYTVHSPLYGTLTSTIPYGETVNIIKVTSDLSWGYCQNATYQGWIKLEDVAAAQVGKYLNAMTIEHINLNTYDWTTEPTSFAAMGIDLQKFLLAYHDAYENTYQGDYNFSELSRLNTVDVVYNEHQYAYNCLYYKGDLQSENLLATEPFTFSIGTFDINWPLFVKSNPAFQTDNFIKMTSSAQSKVGPGAGSTSSIVIVKDATYKVLETQDTWKKIYDAKTNTTCWVDGVNTTTFVPSPTFEGIGKTWANLGVDINKHKPALDHKDGVLIWNPLNYQDAATADIKISDLIIAGGQKVLYPFAHPSYKAMFSHSFTKLDLTLPVGYDKDKLDFEFRTEHLTTSQSDIWDKRNENRFVWKGFFYWGTKIPGRNGTTRTTFGGTDITDSYNDLPDFVIADSIYNVAAGGASKPDTNRWNFTVWKQLKMMRILDNTNVAKPETYREYKTFETVFGPTIPTHDYTYHLSGAKVRNNIVVKNYDKTSKTFSAPVVYNNKTRVWDVVNNKFIHDAEYKSDIAIANGTSVYIGSGIQRTQDIIDSDKVVVNYYKVYYDNRLINWFIALPKGYPVNATVTMPYNGFYDILSGKISDMYYTQERPSRATEDMTYLYLSNDYVNVSGKGWTAYPVLFNETADPDKDRPIDWFAEQQYNTVDVNYPVALTAAGNGYNYPNEYAQQLATYPIGQVMPIAKELVGGAWLFNGYAWIKNTGVSLDVTIPLAPSDVTEVAIKGDLDTSFSGWALKSAPSAEAATNGEMALYDTVMKATAMSGNYYWLGKGWLNLDGTAQYVTATNRHVITVESATCYPQPIASGTSIKTYPLGSELYIQKVLVRDGNWGYTGEGWIRLTSVTDWL